MSVNKVNSDGSLSRVAGGTLYADLAVGSIVPFGGSVVPSGYLLCNGAEVLKTAYAELYAVIGDAFGAASVNTKFVLPDLRESVPKGAGLTGKTVGAHLDADGLAVGEFLDDRVQDHLHRTRLTNIYFPSGDTQRSPVTNDGMSGIGEIGEIVVGRHGVTTEVKAVGVNYIIKAKQVAVPFDVAEYIRNQNVLGDLEGWTGLGSPMPYDGIIYFTTASDINAPRFKLYMNGELVAEAGYNATSNTVVQCDSIPFMKGDIFTITDGGGLISGLVRYYKLRDYSGR